MSYRSAVPSFLHTAFASCLGLLLFPIASGAAGGEKASANQAVKKLLEERLVAAAKIHELAVFAYTKGDRDVSIEQVQHDKAALLKASLALCGKKETRLEVYQEMLKDALEWEKMADKSVRNGARPRADALRARLFRLEVQIAFEEAKAK